MSSITEKGQMESTSDEGFNSGGQTTNSTPDVSQKKQRRRKQRRRENKKDGTGSINAIIFKIIFKKFNNTIKNNIFELTVGPSYLKTFFTNIVDSDK